MKTRLTPGYINIIYEVVLKSFRREQSIRSFLRSCTVPEKYINSWKEDETNSEFIDRIFPELLKTEKGRDALLKIAKFLMYQNQFPDLEFLIDAPRRIKEAHEAVQKLKEYHWRQEEEIQHYLNEQKSKLNLRQKRESTKKSLQTLQEFNHRLVELSRKMDKESSRYLFSEWFFDLLDFYDIKNVRPYNKAGIEEEGKIITGDKVYLIFLVFSLGRTSVIDIDNFYRKVILNTSSSETQKTKGLIISISGFSNLAVQEASGHKTPLILMDHHHIFYVLSGIMGLKDVIEKIDRHAHNTGEAFLLPSDFN